MAEDLAGADVGAGKTYAEPVQKHDAQAGTYQDAVSSVPTDNRLGTAQMPKAPDPSPFSLGPMTGGG